MAAVLHYCKVLHISYIDEHLKEEDFLNYCRRYGHLTRYTWLPSKREAFVEMESNAANNFIHSNQNQNNMQRGRVMRLRVAEAQIGSKEMQNLVFHILSTYTSDRTCQFKPRGRVLRVHVSDVNLRVTARSIKRIFETHGKVEVVAVTGPKPFDTKYEVIQFLVQYSTKEEAFQAFNKLDGKHMQEIGCPLDIEMTDLNELHVSYDSIIPSTVNQLPEQEKEDNNQGPGPGAVAGPGPGPGPGPVAGPFPGPVAGPFPSAVAGPGPGPVAGPFPGAVAGPAPGPVAGPFPGAAAGPGPGPFPGAVAGPGPRPGPGPGSFPRPRSAVLMIKNLYNNINPGTTNLVTTEMLFNIFSLYGNVVKVKLFVSTAKRDSQHQQQMASLNGLVEMENHMEAARAARFLDRFYLFNHWSQVMVSDRKQRIDPDNRPHTDHRFRLLDCKVRTSAAAGGGGMVIGNDQHRIYHRTNASFLDFEPTRLIRISDLPQNVNPDGILRLMNERYGGFIGQRHQGTTIDILFSNVNDATTALACQHGAYLEGCRLSITFLPPTAIPNQQMQ